MWITRFLWWQAEVDSDSFYLPSSWRRCGCPPSTFLSAASVQAALAWRNEPAEESKQKHWISRTQPPAEKKSVASVDDGDFRCCCFFLLIHDNNNISLNMTESRADKVLSTTIESDHEHQMWSKETWLINSWWSQRSLRITAKIQSFSSAWLQLISLDSFNLCVPSTDFQWKVLLLHGPHSVEQFSIWCFSSIKSTPAFTQALKSNLFNNYFWPNILPNSNCCFCTYSYCL